MNQPKMIMFDYGQTLVNEKKFDGVKGTAEVLKYATENRYNLSPEWVQAEANKINKEIGRFNYLTETLVNLEVHNRAFGAYLYESLGIKLSLTPEELDRVFWENAVDAEPTEGIAELLKELDDMGIRTAVVSNMAYAGSVVTDRINRILPDNKFEFIIASSEYIFRKPNPRIFRLALEKARLNASDVWYIGDNYECDVDGARNVGITPVWYKGALRSEQQDRDDVIKITSWSELKSYL
ncbi:MAG: HAD-IIIA family hydrolase [Lachnospiraceae bacterium]|nr:HAD-IIIA family hydrolase [Lachnospiraceae bacterium]